MASYVKKAMGIPWWSSGALIAAVRVQALVWEQRSHIKPTCTTARKKEKKKKENHSWFFLPGSPTLSAYTWTNKRSWNLFSSNYWEDWRDMGKVVLTHFLWELLPLVPTPPPKKILSFVGREGLREEYTMIQVSLRNSPYICSVRTGPWWWLFFF